MPSLSIVVAGVEASSASYVASSTSFAAALTSYLEYSTSSGFVFIMLIVVGIGISVQYTHPFFCTFESYFFSPYSFSALKILSLLNFLAC